MHPTNRVCLARAREQAATELAAIQADSAAIAASLLANSLATDTRSAATTNQLIGDVFANATRIAELAERERIAQARSNAVTTLLAAFDAAFA